MKQAIMIEPGTIEFREVPVPEIKTNQVLVAIKRIGVCGSDIHVFHGLHPYTHYPVVQGHEVSGLIETVGEKVANLKPGDMVTVMPQVVCGACLPCRTGNYHICDHLKVMGFQTGGAAQEFFPVDADHVVRLPDDFSIDQAAMIEPTAVAVHAANRAGNLSAKGVLVLGAGTIGNLVAQTARALGARKILITDINNYKLDKARACGLVHVCDPHKENLGGRIREIFGPDKMDVIFECVGAQETITQAIENARKGSDIVVVGVFGKKPEINLGFIQDRELQLLGTLMYQKEDYETAIKLVAQKLINLSPLVTHRFAFDDYADAYRLIEESHGDYMKVMIDV
jgi:L-iditol 2-dehydrogenase